jgi:hypothetical protein
MGAFRSAEPRWTPPEPPIKKMITVAERKNLWLDAAMLVGYSRSEAERIVKQHHAIRIILWRL